MSNLPDHQPMMLPEGTYTFTLSEEPEKRRHSGSKGEFITVFFKFKVTGNNEAKRWHSESFIPWDERYGQLLRALGGEKREDGTIHLSDELNIVGSLFKADIIHVEDDKDPQKKWARLANIQIDSSDEDEEEVPF